MLANVLFSVKQGTELIPSFFSILQFEDVLFIFKENTLKKKNQKPPAVLTMKILLAMDVEKKQISKE